MSNSKTSRRSLQITLQQLLESYQLEKEEGRKDNDTYYVDYWESACRTIYEVAAALHIPFDDPWVDPSWVRYQQRYHKSHKEQRCEPRGLVDV